MQSFRCKRVPFIVRAFDLLTVRVWVMNWGGNSMKRLSVWGGNEGFLGGERREGMVLERGGGGRVERRRRVKGGSPPFEGWRRIMGMEQKGLVASRNWKT